MRILIATASRHGSTREIGHWLASALSRELSRGDLRATVDVRDASDVDSIAEYDAAIIGSGVYMGRWLRDARRLIAREQVELRTLPVWLFSSGPVDDSTGAQGQPKERKAREDKADWAIEHRTFGGKLDRSQLSRFERAVVRLIGASDGDSRSSAEVCRWAEDICRVLAERLPHSNSAVDRRPAPDA